MTRFFVEEFRLCLPFFPDELCWREAFEGLEPSGVVVGVDEQIKVSAQVIVVIVVIAFDRGLLDRAVHALDLAAIRENSPPDCFLVLMAPRMVGFGQAMLDLVGVADHVEAVHAQPGRPAIPVSRLVGELDAIVGQDDVDLVGNCLQDGLKKSHGRGSVCLFIEPHDGKFRCAINGYEHVQSSYR